MMKFIRRLLVMTLALLIIGSAGALSAPSAAKAADPTPANWYESAKFGIFAHYIPDLTIYPNGSIPPSIDDLADDFNATKFAADMNAFGAEYVTFTAWHGLMQPLYPSSVMDTYRPGNSTTRDVIQDIIDALEPYGIKFMLYIHPTAADYISPADKLAVGWDDPTNGYEAYNDFLNDLLDEVGNRYGDELDGYWVDMIFDTPFQTKVDKPRLYDTLLVGNANRVVVGNTQSFDTPASSYGWLDYVSREYYPSTNIIDDWEPARNQTLRSVSADWWASVPQGTTAIPYNAEDIYRFTVLQAAANTRGGGMVWNLPPYAGSGDLWEDGIEDTFLDVADYMDASGDSIKNTRTSSAYPIGTSISLTNLPNGFVATGSADGSKTYIHVLNPPVGSTISLPAPIDGRSFVSAKLISNDHSVALSQDWDGVDLTLGGGDSWNAVDTIIELSNGPAVATLVNDTDSAITYVGTWGHSTARNAHDYQDDVHYTAANNDYAEYSFYGPSVAYVSSRSNNYGNVDVWIDGSFVSTVSAYSTTYDPQRILFSADGLSTGRHTLKLIKKSGSYMQLDGILAPLSGVVNNTDAATVYTGSWGLSSSRGVGDLADDVAFTSTINDRADFTFVGSGVQMLTPKNYQYGNIDIWVDGTYRATVSAYAASGYAAQSAVYSISGLTYGSHTIRAIMKSGSYMQVDGWRVSQ